MKNKEPFGKSLNKTERLICPECGFVMERIEKKCKVCGLKPEYWYHNKVSGLYGYYCTPCLNGLRRDVSIKEWVKLGFAKRLNHETK